MIILKDSGTFNNTLNSWVYKSDLTPNDSILFETSYVVIGDIFDSSDITANYNLFVLGDMKVDKIHVKKDLFVLGKITANEIKVTGDLSCEKDIECKSIQVGRSLSTRSLQTELGDIGINLHVESAFIDDKLNVGKQIICLEGIAGTGVCKANEILIRDYKNIATECNQLLVLNNEFKKEEPSKKEGSNLELTSLMSEDLFENDQLLEEYSKLQFNINNSLINNFENYTKKIEEQYDYDEISKKFIVLQKKLPALSNYVESYNKIIRFSEKSSISNVEEFISLLNLKHATPKFLYSISIVEDVLIGFYNLQKNSLKELEVINTNIDNVIHNLYFLNQRKYLLSSHEFQILFNKLTSHIKLGGQNETEAIKENHDHELSELFNNIPEIKHGEVQIKKIVRAKGIRSKVAVYSHDVSIDPVGACIGYKGERIEKIMNRLDNEKVDIILWSENHNEFVKNALSPAKVSKVEIIGDSAQVEVSSDQYTFAIGRRGINVKLASEITNLTIEVKMK
ncbi:hypothetical protein [Bacillus pinisoli]|uniref:hypothetical protein n=1 Tax=Bacillus pinisoli TaxID=2901866 RepID=UPI001FF4359C|nr:hypothetical protein [Bacillus pinisoli]